MAVVVTVNMAGSLGKLLLESLSATTEDFGE